MYYSFSCCLNKKMIMIAAHIADGKHVHIYKTSERKNYYMQKTDQRRMHVQQYKQYKYPSSNLYRPPSPITKTTPQTEALEQIGSFSWYVERLKAVNLKYRVIHHCNGQVDSRFIRHKEVLYLSFQSHMVVTIQASLMSLCILQVLAIVEGSHFFHFFYFFGGSHFFHSFPFFHTFLDIWLQEYGIDSESRGHTHRHNTNTRMSYKLTKHITFSCTSTAV